MGLVALTNKHREGEYWFKSGCPTHDPRQGLFLAIANCAQLSSPTVRLAISSYRTTKLGWSGTRRILDQDKYSKSSSATWCSPKPRLQGACSGKAVSWCAGPLASVLRFVSRGWMGCLHSSTAVNFYDSISPSDFVL